MTDRKRIWFVVFAIYCIAMAYLLFGREEAPVGIPYTDQLRLRLNLIPFRTLRYQWKLLFQAERPWLIRHSLVNLSGNLLLFLPLGIFLPKLWKPLEHFRRLLLTTAGIIAVVELTQVLILLGRCDIDDLLLNLIGTVMGYGIYQWSIKERLPG